LEYIYFQGKLVKKDSKDISFLDRGILYGEGLFETLRVYNGEAFLLDKHIARLKKGCSVLGINCDTDDLSTGGIRSVIDANNIVEGSLRITVTGGGKKGLLPAPDSKCTYFITGKPGSPYSPEHYSKGYKGLISSIKRNPYSPLTYLKSLNFLENILAKKEAYDAGYDEAIFLNVKNFLTEGSITNLFIIKDGEVLTPDEKCGLLPGITREVVIDICNKNKIPVKEKSNLSLSDLISADEAFLTNSLIEIMPLVKINKHLINNDRPGSLTKRLSILYKDYIKICSSP
jgi:branched-chain amino acid aminotransferase